MKNITYNSTFVPQGSPANETYDGTDCSKSVLGFTSLTAYSAKLSLLALAYSGMKHMLLSILTDA